VSRRWARGLRLGRWVPVAVFVLLAAGVLTAQTLPPTPAPSAAEPSTDEVEGVREGLLRLPLAAALGAALALRPRRRGTPPRTTAVVQTQIILAVVGAVIMLVVGASLARAFGIVGAANLIRYRSKIDDPKDAVVMLCSLAVGLAAGVGLYLLAAFSTAFLVGALWIIESFEPEAVKHFALSITADKPQDSLRSSIEPILRRYHLKWELRTLADDQLTYEVRAPLNVQTDAISNAIADVDARKNLKVSWDEHKKKSSKDDDG
jgi:uncharacterized membrane protein YhiD involved in acid resistance